ncbi:hypothetical protein [Pandoraea commovens]|uniref:Uncharacterized protein n=1 Tax=Pandoraea commovens TaxID=2508289 RepID=A0A5E4XCE6_9BURK|nr:hypothetical protein [Pandoraea commovens]VVE33885.1 hypothetical protein PCO31010_03813 [Pandoraea commovens]
MLKLAKTDRIVTAYAEPAHGPGWANSPVWLIVRDGNGNLRQECLQRSELSADMHTLYRVSAAAHIEMTSAAERHIKIRKEKKNA